MLALLDIVKKDEISDDKHKNIRKSENKILKS